MEMRVLPNDIELDTVFVDIHCIGKNPIGEGIIINVNCKDKSIYSGIIDEGFNKKIFEENKIEKLNFICWSHPHDDHTNGIKEVIGKYTDKNTMIIVPCGISDVKRKMTPLCKKTYKPIKKINSRGKKRDGEYIEVSQFTVLPTIKFVDQRGKELIIGIKTISPVSKRINNLRNNKEVNLNELSICMIISINGVEFLFTGDIYNNVINEMNINKEDIKNIVYYKIPHHGSNKSNNLLLNIEDIDNDTNKIAVSTIYKKNGEDKTPNYELLEGYIKRGMKVYCTSSSYLKGTNATCDFGVISTRIAMNLERYSNVLNWDIKFEGEAEEVKKRDSNRLGFEYNAK